MIQRTTKNLSAKVSAKDWKAQQSKQQHQHVRRLERTEEIQLGDYERVFPPPAPVPPHSLQSASASSSSSPSSSSGTPLSSSSASTPEELEYFRQLEIHQQRVAKFSEMLQFASARYEEGIFNHFQTHKLHHTVPISHIIRIENGSLEICRFWCVAQN